MVESSFFPVAKGKKCREDDKKKIQSCISSFVVISCAFTTYELCRRFMEYMYIANIKQFSWQVTSSKSRSCAMFCFAVVVFSSPGIDRCSLYFYVVFLGGGREREWHFGYNIVAYFNDLMAFVCRVACLISSFFVQVNMGLTML